MNGKPATRTELRIIRILYPHTSTKVIAQRLHCSVDRVFRLANRLGLHRSAAYLVSPDACRLRRGDEVGKAFRFPPGHVPHNKGTHRPGYAPGRMAETQFKKGQSLNKMPVGATRLLDGYVYRKVSDIPNVVWTRNWRLEHYLVWEKAGRKRINWHTHALIFKDGNRLNTELGNLQRITRKQLMQRNSIHVQYPKPLVDLIMLNGALKRQLRKREAHGEEPTDGRSQPSL